MGRGKREGDQDRDAEKDILRFGLGGSNFQHTKARQEGPTGSDLINQLLRGRGLGNDQR